MDVAVAAGISALVSTSVPMILKVMISGKIRDPMVKSDAKSILSELTLIQAILLDHSPNGRNISHEGKELITQLRRLAEEIEDCIDRFRVGKTSEEKFAGEISELKAKAATTRMEFRSCFPPPSRSAPVTCHEAINGAEEEILGSVVLRLVRENQPETKLKVISIVGHGGPGMTLLAKQVYERVEVRQQFGYRAWFNATGMGAAEVLEELCNQVKNCASTSKNISPEVQVKGIQEEIISKHVQIQKGKGLINDNGIHEAQRYLIVIDNLEAQEIYGIISSRLTDGIDGRIIITSTYELPAEYTYCSCGEGLPHALDRTSQFLRIGELTVNTFNQVKLELDAKVQEVLDSNYESLSNLDLQNMLLYFCMFPCNYLVRRDSLLRRWRAEGFVLDQDAASRNLGTLIERNIIQPLRVGNSGKVKTCQPPRRILEYISKKSKADDFITLFCRQSQTHQPEAYIRRLSLHPNGAIKRGLKLAKGLSRLRILAVLSKQRLEALTTSSTANHPNNSKRWRLKLPIGFSRPRASAVSPTTNSAKTRGLLTKGLSRRRTLAVLPKSLSPLRTLAVFPTANPCNLKYKVKFAKYNLLRVLDLKECDNVEEKHLADICGLSLLKYLSLGDTIGKVPKKIKNLRELETLDMRRTKTVEVYAEVIKLPKLTHLLGKFRLLDTPYKNSEKFLPKDGDLELKLVLETLSGFVSDKSQGFSQLMLHMGQLTKVKIWCDSTADQSESESAGNLAGAIKEFVKAGTRMASVDRSLCVDFTECSAECSLGFLASLQTLGKVTSLKLHGNLTRFMDSLGVQDKFIKLKGLQELCLSWTNLQGNDILAALSNIYSLRYLKLVEDKLGPMEIQDRTNFRGLQRICLVASEALDISIKENALPHLVALHLLCKVPPGTPGIEITHMKGLKEVGLLRQVKEEERNAWQTAASGHANRPDVLFIQGSPRQG